MQNHIPLPVIENSSRSHRLVRSVEDMTAAGRPPASASGRHSIVNSTTVSNETALQAKDRDNRPLVYQKNVTRRLQDGPRAQQIASNGGGTASVCNRGYALASDVGQSLGQRSLGHSGSGSKASPAPCGPSGGFTANAPVILDNPAPPIPATNQSTLQIIRSYGADPAVIFRAAAIAMGYTAGAISKADALALITIGTETGTLSDARALAAAYRAAVAPHVAIIDPELAAEGARLVGAMWHAEYLRLGAGAFFATLGAVR